MVRGMAITALLFSMQLSASVVYTLEQYPTSCDANQVCSPQHVEISFTLPDYMQAPDLSSDSPGDLYPPAGSIFVPSTEDTEFSSGGYYGDANPDSGTYWWTYDGGLEALFIGETLGYPNGLGNPMGEVESEFLDYFPGVDGQSDGTFCGPYGSCVGEQLTIFDPPGPVSAPEPATLGLLILGASVILCRINQKLGTGWGFPSSPRRNAGSSTLF